MQSISVFQILAALPKLIKLNPMVVKEVFNKLLGLQTPDDENPPGESRINIIKFFMYSDNKSCIQFI